MHKLFKLALLSVLLLPAWSACAESSVAIKPLQLGIVPYIGTRALVSSYEPMREYLEKKLGKPVEIYTAAGFKAFYLNAKRGDYDLIISSAQFARILQTQDKLIPLARYASGGSGLIVKGLNSPLNNIQDLRGQTLAMPDQLSLASIVCLTYLRENGLQAGVDFRVITVPSFASAILSVQKGESTAAISAAGALAQMPAELRESVTPLVDTGKFISLVFLAHPQLGKANAKLIKQLLLAFSNDSQEGKQFFSSNGFGSITPITTKEMSSLDRYVAETNRLLNETP